MSTRDEVDHALNNLIAAAWGLGVMEQDSPGWKSIANDAVATAKEAVLALIAPPAPGEARLTTDEAAWVRTWLEPLDQWSSPVAKQIAAKIDAAAAPGAAR